MAERICSYCGKPLEAGVAPVACATCHSLYHMECWASNNGCSAFGCGCKLEDGTGQANTYVWSETKMCHGCKRENPQAAMRCLFCKKELREHASNKIFYSYAGWFAHTPDELIEGLDSHWDSGVRHLYLGDVETWLENNGAPDLAEKAAKFRKENKQRSVGLELFLESTGKVDKPVLSLSSGKVVMEGASGVAETAIVCSNSGRGYLYGKLTSDASWLYIDPPQFHGNREQIILTVDLDNLPSESETVNINVETSGGNKKIEIEARRIGLGSALKAYDNGNLMQAKNFCRRMIDTHSSVAEASVLLAACCIEEDNDSGASAALRKMSGMCYELPEKVVRVVYSWLKEDDSASMGLDKLSIYQSVLPCANEDFAGELKKTIAQVALDKARDNASAIMDSGVSSWYDGRNIDDETGALIAMACENNPELRSEAQLVSKTLSSARSKSRIGSGLGKLAAVVLFLAVLGGLAYFMSTMSSKGQSNLEAVFASGDYAKTRAEARKLLSEEPDNTTYRVYEVRALLGMARQAFDKHESQASETFLENALQASVGIPAATEAVVDDMSAWIEKLREEGRSGEARLKLEKLKNICPQGDDSGTANDKLEQARTKVLALEASAGSDTETFYKLYVLAGGQLGSQCIDNYDDIPEVKNDIAKLSSMGVDCYDSRMHIVFEDFSGLGSRELLVAGCDKKGTLIGKYALYSVEGNLLKKVYEKQMSGQVKLLGIDTGDLSGKGRCDAALAWQLQDDSREIVTNFLAMTGPGKVADEIAPTKYRVELTDRNGDDTCEAWLGENISLSKTIEPTIIMRPYLWAEPGFILMDGDFSKFYNECIERFKEDIKSNPYTIGSDKNREFEADRNKAIGILEDLKRKGSSSGVSSASASSGLGAASK